ncbi:hypothetical protein [Romboutsia lituseburensis]|uniref:Uncharacterized protein n=1 Tax=Romboutsia lituseburensis DSM 797 TaxID=1121325 RepID=A0A1G9PJH3_9FIRM|nr:hypothetical protein [Romboutsia lituseburensis]CEH33405.1 Hypothetical protein RLITU_0803 [Romboutsia lituseburensis]SDL98631.1 hypothetical protein SAMN04515677_104381 [Romboutsia lituseburensis DSM 797]
MLENYTLMYKNIEVGNISYNQDKDQFSFKLNEEIKDTKYLPPILYDYTNLSLDYKPTHENILWWIEDRIMPPERDAIDHILDKMGLSIYNPWTILKENKGMTLEDYWWIRKDNEKYEQCHIRYLLENKIRTDFGRPV